MLVVVAVVVPAVVMLRAKVPPTVFVPTTLRSAPAPSTPVPERVRFLLNCRLLAVPSSSSEAVTLLATVTIPV